MVNGALVLEGGSLRCLFTAGIVDVLIENGIDFSYAIGTSAGSLTAANYISGQPGRTAQVNLKFVGDKRFMGLDSLIKNRMIFNFDFLFGEISTTLLPFDFQRFFSSPQRFVCVASDCATGLPAYFEKGEAPDIFEAMKASSSIPLLSKMVKLEGQPYLDGGFSDPVPFQRAIEEGFEKILVITTRHEGFRKMPVSRAAARAFLAAYRKYPALVTALLDGPRTYARQMRALARLEASGRLMVLRPPEPITISRTEKDTQKLRALYAQGRRTGLEYLPALRDYLGLQSRNTG